MLNNTVLVEADKRAQEERNKFSKKRSARVEEIKEGLRGLGEEFI